MPSSRVYCKTQKIDSIFYSIFEYGDVHLTGDTEGDFVVVDSFLNRGFGGSGSVEAPNEGGNGLSFIAAIRICGGMALAV